MKQRLHPGSKPDGWPVGALDSSTCGWRLMDAATLTVAQILIL
eukprot:CAMPEP_0206135846 /NCGR_PEP_ID=MMETSP1473-20131121/1109_1 /ASSEMBLY_ACC=CAM_ASM_001109 /TAXON_ID=1461547 /ORGANISM="Stichococcus sp, Strain RCC1054" /LENGTH=42 /DNA_ID= /DNA_START= /DNA_END= /DNA_ORIENTATION=